MEAIKEEVLEEKYNKLQKELKKLKRLKKHRGDTKKFAISEKRKEILEISREYKRYCSYSIEKICENSERKHRDKFINSEFWLDVWGMLKTKKYICRTDLNRRQQVQQRTHKKKRLRILKSEESLLEDMMDFGLTLSTEPNVVLTTEAEPRMTTEAANEDIKTQDDFMYVGMEEDVDEKAEQLREKKEAQTWREMLKVASENTAEEMQYRAYKKDREVPPGFEVKQISRRRKIQT